MGREGQACAYSARRFVSSLARNLLGSIQREPAEPLMNKLQLLASVVGKDKADVAQKGRDGRPEGKVASAL